MAVSNKLQVGGAIAVIAAWLAGVGLVITFWVLVFKALMKYIGS